MKSDFPGLPPGISPPDPALLDALSFSAPPEPGPNAYVKKTVLQSPIVVKIVPQFTVCLTKPLSGLTSSYLSEEKDQTLVPPPQDSFFGDDMSEDDALMDLGMHTSMDRSQDSLDVKIAEEKYADIEVLVKHTSLLLDGAEYALSAAVTAASVVPKSDATGTNEDSLLLALQSGFQLLIRVWRVPRRFSDASFEQGPTPAKETNTSHVYKPFVVQWWRLSGEESVISPCSALTVHPLGLSVVSAAPDSVFRIHACENTASGLQLSSHRNIPVDGAVLHSCFAPPLEALAADTHLVFMVLTFTHSSRLALSLYSWYASETLSGTIEKSTLPLNDTFPLPVMVVPLCENGSFLFVCPDEFVIVTVNNIWSADYSFSKFAYDGTFPTAYSVAPAQRSTDSGLAMDEVFLASDCGVVYSVIITANREVTCRPLLRIADPISNFTLNHSAENDGFMLTYASDTAGIKALFFESLSPAANSVPKEKMPYTEATLLRDYKNWAPIVDVQLIDSPPFRNFVAESAQEMWALTGIGKRTKLTHLRSGYVIKRESRTLESFRKAQSISLLAKKETQYLLCSMPFETRLFDYVPEIDENEMDETDETDWADPDPLLEVESALISEESTLCCSFLPDSGTAFQITRSKIGATDMRRSKTSTMDGKQILFAQIVRDIAILAVDMSGSVTIEIVKLSEIADFDSDTDLVNGPHFRVLASVPGAGEISMLRCFEYGNEILILCGSFLCALDLLRFDTTTETYTASFSLDLGEICKEKLMIPHDVAFSQQNSKLYVGSKCGHFAEFDLDNFQPKLVQTLALGTTPVTLVLSENDPHFLFACLRNLWLFNFYASAHPMRVSFDEKTDKAIYSVAELPTSESQHLRFAFLREDGLVVGSVFCHEKPILRQLGIGEPAKKLLFLDTSNLFVVLCKSKNQSTRLKFAERKSFKLLPTVEIDAKSGAGRNEWIFGPSEIPTCALVWHISRNERVSKKVIVGTSAEKGTGKLKILDISKVVLEGTRTPTVKVVELWSISRDEPVTSIQQIGATIFFAAGPSVYSTSYSLDSKKFRPVSKLSTLSSNVTNLSVAGDDTLLVNTQMDSVVAFQYSENDSSDSEGQAEKLTVKFKDPIPRCLVNATAIGNRIVTGDKLFSALRVFDPESSSHHSFNLQFSMIPRVYTADFSAYWNRGTDDNQICCVGVNGQIVTINPVFDGGTEITELNRALAVEHKLSESGSLDTVMERLGRPFLEKITGKGFLSVYKPFFDFGDNRGKFIDYDVEELARMSRSGLLL